MTAFLYNAPKDLIVFLESCLDKTDDAKYSNARDKAYLKCLIAIKDKDKIFKVIERYFNYKSTTLDDIEKIFESLNERNRVFLEKNLRRLIDLIKNIPLKIKIMQKYNFFDNFYQIVNDSIIEDPKALNSIFKLDLLNLKKLPVPTDDYNFLKNYLKTSFDNKIGFSRYSNLITDLFINKNFNKLVIFNTVKELIDNSGLVENDRLAFISKLKNEISEQNSNSRIKIYCLI
jgi:hypothetical protein